jgi:hypothetical protein
MGVEVRRIAFAAMACALASGTAKAQPDFSYAGVSPGSWTYRAVTGGSEATFVDTIGQARMVIGCGTTTRLVTLSRIGPAPAASLLVWTSSASRNLASRFDLASKRVIAQTAASDSLLDAIVFSRGRFAISMPGSPALVLPSTPEIAHVVEDCRA